MTMVEEKQYAVESEKLKEYFPMEVVTAGMMDIYQKILGLKFTRLEGGAVWHEDVEMWQAGFSTEFFGSSGMERLTNLIQSCAPMQQIIVTELLYR